MDWLLGRKTYRFKPEKEGRDQIMKASVIYAPSPKSHTCIFPRASLEQSLTALRFCVPGCHPHFAPVKTQLALLCDGLLTAVAFLVAEHGF